MVLPCKQSGRIDSWAVIALAVAFFLGGVSIASGAVSELQFATLTAAISLVAVALAVSEDYRSTTPDTA